MKEYCQLCEVTEINRKAFEKLDEMAASDERIICRDCYNGSQHRAVIIVRAETKTAMLVKISWF